MARYNPDNQYVVKTIHNGIEEVYDAFLQEGRYYIKSNQFISEEYITSVEKIEHEEDDKTTLPQGN